MKGFAHIARVLAATRAKPRTAQELSDLSSIQYISLVRLVKELRLSGLIVKAGHRNTGLRGPQPALYAFHGGEATEVGRPITRRFLRLWNAMLEPDSAAAIAAEAGVNENHTRKTIHAMRDLRLCRIADWQRNHVSIPTALYALGQAPDAPRPAPQTNLESDRRVAANRKARQLYDALTWRLAA